MCSLSVFLMQLLMPFISGLLCSLVSLGFMFLLFISFFSKQIYPKCYIIFIGCSMDKNSDSTRGASLPFLD